MLIASSTLCDPLRALKPSKIDIRESITSILHTGRPTTFHFFTVTNTVQYCTVMHAIALVFPTPLEKRKIRLASIAYRLQARLESSHTARTATSLRHATISSSLGFVLLGVESWCVPGKWGAQYHTKPASGEASDPPSQASSGAVLGMPLSWLFQIFILKLEWTSSKIQ